MGLRVEAGAAVRPADCKDHDAKLMVNSRAAHGCSRQRGFCPDPDLFNQHLEGAGTITGNVKKVEQVRAQKALRNTMAGSSIGRDHYICAGCSQVFFCSRSEEHTSEL